MNKIYFDIGQASTTSLRRRTIVAALVLACLGRVVIAAQGNGDAAKVKNPVAAKVKNPIAATPESVAAGKQIFQKSCAPC